MQKTKMIMLVGIIATALMGCQSADSEIKVLGKGTDSEITVKTSRLIEEEYRESVAKLKWPAGYEPNQKLEGLNPEVTYQEGFGDTMASTVYECAWTGEWLQKYAISSDEAANALIELEKVLEMGYLSEARADDNTRKWVISAIEKAKLGDPSGLQQNYDVNCKTN